MPLRPLKLLVKAPAKVMIFGEYCVLWGKTSLAFTPDCDMTTTIEASPDTTTTIQSDIWPRSVNLDEENLPSFASGSLYHELIIELRQRFALSPFHLRIASSWAIEDGMGSSSALVLSCFTACFAFAKYSGKTCSNVNLTTSELETCTLDAYKFQLKRQGFASGYDIASQAQGGLVQFSGTPDSWPSSIEAHPDLAKALHKLVHVFRGGKGAPTQGLGKETLAWIESNKLREILCENDQAAQSALLSALQENPSPGATASLIRATARHRNLFINAPAFPKYLLEALSQVEGFDKDFTFKTSGAGGEDAILLIGLDAAIRPAQEALGNLGWKKMPFQCASKGLRLQVSSKQLSNT